MKKSHTILVVIFFNLNSLKISYANGRVSVRFFTKIIQSPSVYLRYLRYLFVFFFLYCSFGALPKFLQCPHAVEVVFFQTLLSSLFDRASLFCVNE
jgi:hypothetical protein